MNRTFRAYSPPLTFDPALVQTLDNLLDATATNVSIPVGARQIVDTKTPHLTRMCHLDNHEIDQMLMYEWLTEGLRLRLQRAGLQRMDQAGV